MATFFGEVVVAPSRAGVDDEEETEETAEDREIRKELQEKSHLIQPPFCHQGLHAHVSCFLETEFCLADFMTISFLRNLLNLVLLCQCSCYVAEDQQFQWLEKVFGHIRKEGLQVTILSTCPVAEYKTQESTLTLPSPFLKALKTKEFEEEVCCPLLEQPNIVRDLPAAVLSYCQVWQIPAVLYQCYTDIIKLDTVTIEAFKPLLYSKPLKNLVKSDLESQRLTDRVSTVCTAYTDQVTPLISLGFPASLEQGEEMFLAVGAVLEFLEFS
ncbi:UNVERIFIED_CONTAM: hypothetical protein H355_000338 [Colinus virginianus]|nr:hypothetical protein H355_000338 [Colinus virginianus]